MAQEGTFVTVLPGQNIDETKPAIEAETAEPALKGDAAEAARVRRNKILLYTIVPQLIFGLAGFIGPMYVGLTTNEWYVDAAHHRNYSITPGSHRNTGKLGWGDGKDVWDAGIFIHCITALIWWFACLFQVVTATTGTPGDKLKQWHRKSGYVATAIMMIMEVEAIFFMALMPFESVWVAVCATASMIMVNLFIGLHAIRKKEYTYHKRCMQWTAVWSCIPGTYRLFVLINTSITGCQLEQFSFYTTIAFLGTIITNGWVGIKLGETKDKLFIGNMCMCATAIAGELLGHVREISVDDRWCKDDQDYRHPHEQPGYDFNHHTNPDAFGISGFHSHHAR